MAKSRSRAPSIALACLVIASSSLAVVQAEEPDTAHARRPRYELIDLGLPYYSVTAGINNKGQIVGSSNVPPPAPHVMESTAAQLYQDGTVTNLGSLGGYISAAFGINDRGEIVGYSDTGPDTTSPLHAFLYRDGKMTDLGTFGGQNSDAVAINSHGVITGAADRNKQ